ncbi:hypothetical protein CYA_2400 [Synechococcus sp. JA-3-3Ab]|nr:hypothetical protein CYA_2400 [Synechococcus sp. JA-3-3Ab]
MLIFWSIAHPEGILVATILDPEGVHDELQTLVGSLLRWPDGTAADGLRQGIHPLRQHRGQLCQHGHSH